MIIDLLILQAILIFSFKRHCKATKKQIKKGRMVKNNGIKNMVTIQPIRE